MKPIIFMFYYLNVKNLTVKGSREYIKSAIEYTKLDSTDNYEIIQQYFPVTNQETKVDVFVASSVNSINTKNDVDRIKSNLSYIVEELKNKKPIKNINDLYE